MDRVKWLLDAVTGSFLGVTVEYDSNGSLTTKEISAERGESIFVSNTAELQQLKTSSQVSCDYENAEGKTLDYI